MTAILADGHTRGPARAPHWRAAGRAPRERMDCHQGWGIAADPLEQLAQSLRAQP